MLVTASMKMCIGVPWIVPERESHFCEKKSDDKEVIHFWTMLPVDWARPIMGNALGLW